MRKNFRDADYDKNAHGEQIIPITGLTAAERESLRLARNRARICGYRTPAYTEIMPACRGCSHPFLYFRKTTPEERRAASSFTLGGGAHFVWACEMCGRRELNASANHFKTLAIYRPE